MAKVGKFCLAKRVKVEWLFQLVMVSVNPAVTLPSPVQARWFIPRKVREVNRHLSVATIAPAVAVQSPLVLNAPSHRSKDFRSASSGKAR